MGRALRAGARLGALGVMVAAAYVVVTFAQVWRSSLSDEARPAQAIVVLGAAQYDGKPSPVFRARLDHAAALYQRGLAPLITVTGGRQPGDRFTEATAAAGYLHDRGVPDSAILREVSGATSYESLAAAARFLRRQHVTDVLLVSDPFHSYRIAAIAGEVGLRPHVSPTPSSPLDRRQRLRQLARETFAVSAGRLVGYRRLTRLEPLTPLAHG